MSPASRRLASIAAIAAVAIASSAAAKTPAPSCKTVKCVNCQKECYTTYEKQQNGPNWNPSTAPIYKRQYYSCRKECVAKDN
jgi:hypothetical protein